MNDVAIAILDDYQGVALELADWSRVHANITVFRERVADVATLAPFSALCLMRERTPLTRATIEQLPRLGLVCSTGSRNASIDAAALRERNIELCFTGHGTDGTVELTWALILASTRHVVEEHNAVRAGGWQHTLGEDLSGKTLGVLGLGRLGTKVARIGAAFGMRTIAWSENLESARAAEVGVERVAKDELFAQADVLSVHVVLSDRTRGLVGARELGLMKPTARLVNTSRGPIVDTSALITALEQNRLAGAALDVYDQEPLPLDHPLRSARNVITTPHIGYVTRGTYAQFYGDTVAHLERWLAKRPNRDS